MKNIDVVMEICGSAGEGTISSGEILARLMSSRGFEIMSFDSYPAEIRGFGKCVAHIRISNRPIYSPGKFSDILISLNDAHSISRLPRLKKGAILIYDNQPARVHAEDESVAGMARPDIISYGVPLHMLAHKAAGNSRGRNMVALGAIASLLGLEKQSFILSIQSRFKGKNQAVIDANTESFVLGFDWTDENIKKKDAYSFKNAKQRMSTGRKLIVDGNQLVARAALDAGLKFYAGYPITPATGIMEILSRELPKHGGTLLQTEDEIAAIGAVIGAGFGGIRAMTATSGPGFALMTEFAGLSVMAEVPAVIVNSQRGGPSTGIPTKVEQSDFNAAVYGGTGDSPRVVLAPADTASCYDAVVLALYFAEKYQTLVIVLMDFFLSGSIRNIDVPAKIQKKFLDANITPDAGELKDYKRYRITSSGISPRAIPGMKNAVFFSTGLEHDERSRPDYSEKGHLEMTAKRFRKLETLGREAPLPAVFPEHLTEADIGIVSWGSSAGAAYEASTLARDQGINAACFSSVMLSPFPEKQLISFAEKCRQILVPELNFSGQFADFVTKILKRKVEKLNFISGRPMASEDILQKIKDMV